MIHTYHNNKIKKIILLRLYVRYIWYGMARHSTVRCGNSLFDIIEKYIVIATIIT